jgi:biopolymer transport protein ExbD
MAQIENAAVERKGKSFSISKKHVLKIDMTPMVDLGFLLITFFVFTTTISTPTVADLFMPKEDTIKPQNLADGLALTVLLDDNNKIYYYHGGMDKAIEAKEIYETNYSTYKGLGEIIRRKQKDIDASGKFEEGRNGLMLVIKPTSSSVYKNVIDALDEVMINDVKKYAIVEPVQEEINYIAAKKTSGF